MLWVTRKFQKIPVKGSLCLIFDFEYFFTFCAFTKITVTFFMSIILILSIIRQSYLVRSYCKIFVLVNPGKEGIYMHIYYICDKTCVKFTFRAVGSKKAFISFSYSFLLLRTNTLNIRIRSGTKKQTTSIFPFSKQSGYEYICLLKRSNIKYLSKTATPT